MLGKETLPEQIKELLKGNDFIRYFPREKIYVMHSILQNYLKNQFYQYHSKAFQKKVLRSAGQCCIAETDYFTAAKFFFEIKDFDALLTTPFNGLYLTNKRESNMIEFLKDIIDECPEETMAKYPYVLLMFSYLLRMDGEYEYFQKLCRIIEAVIKNNPAGLDKSELRRIKGEYLLLTSFINYNDIKQVNEGQKAAYELLGGPSMFRVKDIPVTLGATSLLSIFWREPGKLDEILTDVEELLPYNIKLTNGQGTGADIALKAEVLFFRGDDIQAEIFCHKAIYLARSKQEIYICLCAEQMLARIAILRGDVNGFFTVLDNIKGYAGDHANVFVLRMVDICLSALSVALGTKDLVAKWFCDIESISRKVYARAVPYVSMLYLYLLVKEKRYAELLGLADNIINMSKEMNYVLPQVYIYIYKAEVYYKCGREREALENLKEAFVLAFPDKILLPFAQFNFIGDMLSKANFFPMLDQDSFVTSKKEKDDVVLSEGQESAPEYKAALKEIMMLFKRYNKGKIKILNALSQTKSPLTPREREVALLARARLSNKEIAEKLHISQATVRTILYNAYNKLGIHSKYELNEIDF